MRTKYLFTIVNCILWGCLSLSAQSPVQVGKGSYASYTPLSESKTDEHNGDQSRYQEYKTLYVNENAGADKGWPIPSNKWWSYLVNSQYSGNMWVYPQVVKAENYGIYVAYPSYWNDNGTEMKWNSMLQIKGDDFNPASAIAQDWSDWSIVTRLEDEEKRMDVTMAHGIPFTFVEWNGFSPILTLDGADFFDGNGTIETFPYTGSYIGLQSGEEIYAVYVPENTRFTYADGSLFIDVPHDKKFLSIALLSSTEQLEDFASYAYAIPRQTNVSWDYDVAQGKVTTTFHIEAEDLRNGTQHTDVMQGFIPHHYKRAQLDFEFTPYTFQTPRGMMKMATGKQFSISYDFKGILPYFAAPDETAATGAHPFNMDRMRQMIEEYSQQGSFGGDTYWGGKGLTQMAHYMVYAYELGEMELFNACKTRLKEALVNWLTYTPGEESYYFARYNRWGSLVGYNTSYGSDTFNDHHFHYGYYTYAGALLALFDEEFRNDYGEMLTLLAKDYANWDRNDTRFPLFRTLDIWAGHSYAGGSGDSNGNGQESTSEAMQGWGGLFLLGVALDNAEMRDAGAFGWVNESRATAEYWFDRDRENIDYSKYTHPYSSNLTSAGVGWWTWFSGDPVWMHSIQWLPVSPCLDYLSEDLEFAEWEYTEMWNKKEVGDWDKPGVNANGDATGLLADESGLGNVVLAYLQRFNPDSAAAVFDWAWLNNKNLAKNPDTGGISYYLIHSHRSYGDIDWGVHASIATATAYNKNGEMTYVAYNPSHSAQEITFYRDNIELVSFMAPARKMTVYQDEPHADHVIIEATSIVEPNDTTTCTAKVYDQYGMEFPGNITWNSNKGNITPNGLLTATSQLGDTITVVATFNELHDTSRIAVNHLPVLTQATLTPQIELLEIGQETTFELIATDQYGQKYTADIAWVISLNGDSIGNQPHFVAEQSGMYQVKARLEGQEFVNDFLVAPNLPNLALHKTTYESGHENVGTLPEYATDGDYTTRWGSEHSEPEWIYVDLGATAYIASVTIHWETSYAAEYEIQISDNGNDWETAAHQSLGQGGVETLPIHAKGRYVKMLGLKRSNQYGFSFYEMEVNGVFEDGNPDELLGIQISPDNHLMRQYEQVELNATCFNRSGQATAITPVWTVDPAQGQISDEGIFTPTSYGTMHVSATYDGMTAQATFIVEEAIRLGSIEISPERALVVSREEQAFTINGFDQFEVPFAVEDLNIQLLDSNKQVTGKAQFANGIFYSNHIGNYYLIVGQGNVTDTAYIEVKDILETNLAYHKNVTASSEENVGTLAVNAVDEDETSRWGSKHNATPEWLMIDLGKSYKVHTIEILWEAASAKAYQVQLSTDLQNWYIAEDITDGASGSRTDTWHIDETEARYVRIWCTVRNMPQYGYSLYEVRVFGNHANVPSNIEDTEDSDIPYVVDGHNVYIKEPNQAVSLYNLLGQCLISSGYHTTLYLPESGVYLLYIGHETYKILIQ